MKLTAAILISLGAFAGFAGAIDLRVPDEYETIQDAVNATEDGDRVLVSEGEYVENIVIYTAIALIGDRSNPASVIINGENGDRDGSVIQIRAEEAPGVLLAGLTLCNGNGTVEDFARWGGAIMCYDNHRTIVEDCIIHNNYATTGSGIFAFITAPIIRRTIFSGNTAENGATVTVVYTSQWDGIPLLSYCRFFDNTNGGSLLQLTNNNELLLDHCTLANNSADRSLIVTSASTVVIRNFILSNNNTNLIDATGNRVTTLAYNLLEFGDALRGAINMGQGNIDADPQFVDVDRNNFHLRPESPCIDSGDPASPPDDDHTRSDMGAIAFNRWFVFQGTITGGADSEPVPEAYVGCRSPEGVIIAETESARDGTWHIAVPYRDNDALEIEASAAGFGETVIDIADIDDEHDTVEVSIHLTQARFFCSLPEVRKQIPPDTTKTCIVYFNNAGDDTLSWTGELSRLPIDGDWIQTSRLRGTILPGDEQELALHISTWGFPAGHVLRGRIDILHNAPGGEQAIEVRIGILGESIEHLSEPALPNRTMLLSLYPTPFNSTTVARYGLNAPGRTQIALHDLSGRPVAVLFDEYQPAGFYSLPIGAASLPAGVYILRLQSGESISAMKVILAK